jgi:hypothetical protein
MIGALVPFISTMSKIIRDAEFDRVTTRGNPSHGAKHYKNFTGDCK